MKRIVLTGPESSGKSTLAQHLAAEFDTAWVPEYARSYLGFKGGDYELQDLINIAIGQLVLLESVETSLVDKPCVFLDTWMLEIGIWAEYRFGRIPQIITQIRDDNPADLYVLCTPDLAWEPDPLRENPHDRDFLFDRYAHAVEESGAPHIRVAGTGSGREIDAVAAVRTFLG